MDKRKIVAISIIVGAAILGGIAVPKLSANKAPPVEVKVAKAALTVEVKEGQIKEIDDEITINGEVSAWQESVIGSELSGVRVNEILVDVGQVVEKGQVLAVLNSETITADYNIAKAGAAEAEANLKQAKENADRARSLDKTNALSVQQMNQYLTAETTAQAKLESAIANLELKKVRLEQTKIKAPDSGIVSSRTVAVGNIVSSGELFRIIRQEKLQWKPELSIDKLDDIKKGQEVNIVAKSGKMIKARVSEISPRINVENRRATILVDLPKELHKNRVYLGMFVSGTIKVGKKNSLMVKQEAVVLRDGTNYVFVLDESGNKVNQIKVVTGKREGDLIEVEEGITVKDKVVVGGASFLSDGDAVKVVK